MELDVIELFTDESIEYRFIMVFKNDIQDSLREGRRLANKLATDLKEKHPKVIAIALVGSWAHGMVSKTDMDFVVVVEDKQEKKEIWGKLDNSNEQMTFILYTISDILKLTSRKVGLNVIKTARKITRYLRHHRMIKRSFVALLGRKKSYFQQYEILPYTFQTWIPLYERDDILTELQKEQISILGKNLSNEERILYSHNGFFNLIKKYSLGELERQRVCTVLVNSDIDYLKYLRRAIKYSSGGTDRIRALYNDCIRN